MESSSSFTFLSPGDLVDGELRLTLGRTYQHRLHHDWLPAYAFQMECDGRPAGGLRLRIGDGDEVRLYFGHIGFDVDEPFRGRHFAERSCRLVFPLARRHGLRELWMTCNPDNVASRRTLERLGGEYVETIALPTDNVMYEKGEREKRRYRFVL